jgi:hypothetical protein
MIRGVRVEITCPNRAFVCAASHGRSIFRNFFGENRFALDAGVVNAMIAVRPRRIRWSIFQDLNRRLNRFRALG